VPDKGELVSINGEPYRVFERQWAFGDAGRAPLKYDFSPNENTYCYLYVR